MVECSPLLLPLQRRTGDRDRCHTESRKSLNRLHHQSISTRINSGILFVFVGLLSASTKERYPISFLATQKTWVILSKPRKPNYVIPANAYKMSPWLLSVAMSVFNDGFGILLESRWTQESSIHKTSSLYTPFSPVWIHVLAEMLLLRRYPIQVRHEDPRIIHIHAFSASHFSAVPDDQPSGKKPLLVCPVPEIPF